MAKRIDENTEEIRCLLLGDWATTPVTSLHSTKDSPGGDVVPFVVDDAGDFEITARIVVLGAPSPGATFTIQPNGRHGSPGSGSIS